MRMAIKVVAGMAVTVIGAALLAGLFTVAANAATGGPVSKSSTVRTYCRALVRWDATRAMRDLDAMMTASEYVTWDPYGVDANILYTESREGDHADIPGDLRFALADCGVK